MIHRAALLPLLLLCAISLHADTVNFDIGDVAVRVISGPDADGDLEIAILVPVQNMSDASIYVDIYGQAVDESGFELFEFNIEGTVQAANLTIISDTDYIGEDSYHAIRDWQIESVDIEVSLR